MARWWALLIVPFASGPLLGARLADRLAQDVALALEHATRLLPAREPTPEPELHSEPVVDQAAPDGLEARGPGETKRLASARRKPLVPPPAPGAPGVEPQKPPSAIRVPKSLVLALANRRVSPAGRPVPKTDERPAGLALSGVSALGLGVQDADVLTSVEGQPALSPGVVIDAVVRARGRRAPTVSGILYRGKERYVLVVEQPY